MHYLLAIFFVVYPIADIITFGEGIGLATLSGGLLLIATPIAFVKWVLINRERPKLSAPSISLLFLLAFASLSGIWAYNQELFQSYILAFAQTVALIVVCDLFLRNRKEADNLLRAYIVGATALALFICWEYLQGTAFNEESNADAARYSLQGTDPNGKAMQLSLGIAILLGHVKLFEQSGLNLTLVGLLSLGVVLTGSRTGFIACVALFSCYMLYESKVVNALQKWAGAIFAVTLFYAFWDFRSKTISLDRVEKMLERGITSDLSGRDTLWANAFTTFADHPFIGIGFGTIQAYNRDFFGNFLVAHNTHLTFLAEVGLLGYILFLFTYSFAPRYWLRFKETEARRTYLAIFIVLILSSITLSLAQNFLFWIFLITLERSVRPRTESDGLLSDAHSNAEIENRIRAIRRA